MIQTHYGYSVPCQPLSPSHPYQQCSVTPVLCSESWLLSLYCEPFPWTRTFCVMIDFKLSAGAWWRSQCADHGKHRFSLFLKREFRNDNLLLPLFLSVPSRSLNLTASALDAVADWLSYVIVPMSPLRLTDDSLILVQTQCKYHSYYEFMIAITVSCPEDRIVQSFPPSSDFYTLLTIMPHVSWTLRGMVEMSCLRLRTHPLLILNSLHSHESLHSPLFTGMRSFSD